MVLDIYKTDFACAVRCMVGCIGGGDRGRGSGLLLFLFLLQFLGRKQRNKRQTVSGILMMRTGWSN